MPCVTTDFAMVLLSDFTSICFLSADRHTWNQSVCSGEPIPGQSTISNLFANGSDDENPSKITDEESPSWKRYSDCIPSSILILKFSMLEELYIDMTTNCREEFWCRRHSRPIRGLWTDNFQGRPFFRAKRIFVICSGTGENTTHNQFTLSDGISDDNGSTTVKERIAKADMWCARLFEWGEATKRLRLKNEEKRALRSATGERQIDKSHSNGSSDRQNDYRQGN
ncbi:hypothetical protein DL98DRAFT_529377 [Cadophora sp. DSE1049]|nr:hypothetical protein DL98DRAFT_529377 [Cadophora sp. DSE1049]